VNGAPAAGVESETVKSKPGALYALAADGTRIGAAAAAATNKTRRLVAGSPDELSWLA